MTNHREAIDANGFTVIENILDETQSALLLAELSSTNVEATPLRIRRGSQDEI